MRRSSPAPGAHTDGRFGTSTFKVLMMALCSSEFVGCASLADRHVAVTSTAASDYTMAKFHAGHAEPQSYVFMPGRYFDGRTVDRSLEKTSFRQLATSLAMDLARDEYYPARDLKSADLLIIVHWGVTTPQFSMDQIRGRVSFSMDTSLEKATENLKASPDDGVGQLFATMGAESDRRLQTEIAERETDRLDADFSLASNAKLLGYNRHLRRMNESPFSCPDEVALRYDLISERYFVILRAYDLHQLDRGKPRPVWTVHMNMRSPGHNFPEAMDLMGTVAVNYFGRQTENVETLTAKERQPNVTIGEIVIIGDAR